MWHTCHFESIHPFNDGNRRVVINYLLMGNKFQPIIIFESDRKEYYWALVHFNEKQKIDKMVEFLDNQTYIT